MSKIIVFTGPMKCGKTKTLIDIYNYIKISKNSNILVIKPKIDNRYSTNEVVSRNGNKVQCYNVEYLKDIIEKFNLNVINDILIDEYQFIKGNIKDLLKIKSYDVNVYVFGLDKTSELKPFKMVTDAIKVSNIVVRLKGVCDICGKNLSEYTYYEGNKTEDILVGDDNYFGVCRKCYKKLKKVH